MSLKYDILNNFRNNLITINYDLLIKYFKLLKQILNFYLGLVLIQIS